MRLLTPGKGLIGVEISSCAVKLLELKPRANQYEVASYAVSPLREGAVVEGRIHNADDVAGALRRAVDYAKPSSRKAAISVPAALAYAKTLPFPQAFSEEDIEECIITDPERYIPFPLDKGVFDFQLLGPAPPHADKQQVLLVACRQEIVRQLLAVLETAGLDPVAVDVETYAIERVFDWLRPALSNQRKASNSTAFIDIGTHRCAFHVMRHGHSVFSRDTLFDAQMNSRAMRECGASTFEDSIADREAGVLLPTHSFQMMASFVDAVVQQIGRSLQLYYASACHYQVTEMLLAGDASMVPGLAERMADESGLSVSLANPLQHMRFSKRCNKDDLMRHAPAMVTACGLAIRAGRKEA